MSSAERLREFVKERLSAAAEEIFRVFKQTIVEYEEEIDRQRRLLDVVWKPEIKLHRIDLPRQRVYTEEVLTDQQFCIQERNSSLDRGDPEPPQIKEEQEELWTSQEGEQLVLKEETETFMLTPPDEDSDHSEQEQNYNHEYLAQNSHVADQKGVKHEDSRSTRDAKSEPKNRRGKKRIHNNSVYSSTTSEIHCNTHTGKKTFKCDFCGKYFKRNSTLHIHLRIHTGEKPYTCETCGNAFRTNDHLIVHMRRSHTGEKPYTCKTCGRSFTSSSELISHTRTHTGEKPYSCMTCRKGYREISALKKHLRIHTGEKPYTCKTCGKAFRLSSALKIHVRIHTGEKPHVCKICGNAFRQRSNLAVHMRRAHAELPQQKVPTDQQLCIQERNFTVDQNDPKPPQIKEEQEELCTSQEGEQLVLKEEANGAETPK